MSWKYLGIDVFFNVFKDAFVESPFKAMPPSIEVPIKFIVAFIQNHIQFFLQQGLMTPSEEVLRGEESIEV